MGASQRWSVALAVVVSACSDTGVATCAELLRNAQDYLEVSSATPPTLAEDDASLRLVLTNSSAEERHVRAKVDGAMVLDVVLPAGGHCSHQPVYFIGIEAPLGSKIIEVDDDEGMERVELGRKGESAWVVVQVQDGFRTEVTRWTTRPTFG